MNYAESCIDPAQAFEHVFDTIHRSVTNGGAFINNEWVSLLMLPANLNQHDADCCWNHMP